MFETIIQRICKPQKAVATTLTPQLTPLPGIKAVLCDLYGTLFISNPTKPSMPSHEALTQALVVSGFEGELDQAGHIGFDLFKKECDTWREAGRETGVDVPEVEVTKIWRKVIHILLNTETLRGSDELDSIRKLALEYEYRINPIYPMPGAAELLSTLNESGKTLGLIANAQFYTPLLFPAFFNKTVEEMGFDPSCCIWSYKELKAKPSAELFPKAAKFLKQNHNIELHETVYVGNDMLNDIYCASQAGCKTVLFAGDQQSLRLREEDERCKNLQPNAIITALDQLPGLLV